MFLSTPTSVLRALCMISSRFCEQPNLRWLISISSWYSCKSACWTTLLLSKLSLPKGITMKRHCRHGRTGWLFLLSTRQIHASWRIQKRHLRMDQLWWCILFVSNLFIKTFDVKNLEKIWILFIRYFRTRWIHRVLVSHQLTCCRSNAHLQGIPEVKSLPLRTHIASFEATWIWISIKLQLKYIETHVKANKSHLEEFSIGVWLVRYNHACLYRHWQKIP